MKKLPYMPLYGKDAWSDEKFLAADWDVQGMFWRLLWWQWQEGSIPADISAVVDVIGKPVTTRRLWSRMQGFFVSCGEGRLRNEKLNALRVEALKEKNGQQKGAAITNAKRWGGESLEVSLSESLYPSLPATEQRVASRIATALESSTPVVLEGVQGEPTPPHSPPPDFEAVARILPRFAQVGVRTTPTEQTLVGLVQTYGEAMILEALADKEPNLPGKSWQYVETVLKGWKENPNERPSNRKTSGKRAGNNVGTGTKRSAKDFGMRTLDDVLAAKRSV